MTYKLLDNERAVLLTRQPEIVYNEELYIEFSDAPSDCTAVFENRDIQLYRTLKDNACAVPLDKLDGIVKVTVVKIDGSARPPKWICEEFKIDKLTQGGVLIAPNDMNLPQNVCELRIENQKLRQMYLELKKEMEQLHSMLTNIMEGYDFL
jgi:hypothetical protein